MKSNVSGRRRGFGFNCWSKIGERETTRTPCDTVFQDDGSQPADPGLLSHLRNTTCHVWCRNWRYCCVFGFYFHLLRVPSTKTPAHIIGESVCTMGDGIVQVVLCRRHDDEGSWSLSAAATTVKCTRRLSAVCNSCLFHTTRATLSVV